MTNEDRRIARRQRRQAKRLAKKTEELKDCTFENVIDIDSLHKAAVEAARNVRWKKQTQLYLNDWLENAVRVQDLILAGKDPTMPRTNFDVFERGKVRHVSSTRFHERVVQKSLSRNAIGPVLRRSFTTGNSANMKGRGTDYAIRRMKKQLVKHVHKHGQDGYILLCDYSNYFASIPISGIRSMIASSIEDDRIKSLSDKFLEREGSDTGLGLGSEQNQIFATGYPSEIDHWIEECSGCEATGRYMDDLYVLDMSKDKLKEILKVVKSKSEAIGLTLNMKKTHIVKLSHGFSFLKKKWSISSTGRIIIRPSKRSATTHRRKLKKMHKLAINGKLDKKAIMVSHMSWRGYLLRFDAHRTLRNEDLLYFSIMSDLFDRQI